MIQDIINNITTAEMEAEEIVKLALQKSKDVKLAAEVEVARIKKEATKQCREVARQTKTNAEVAALKKTDLRLKEGKKAVDAFIASCEEKTGAAVDMIVGRLVSKYGNN